MGRECIQSALSRIPWFTQCSLSDLRTVVEFPSIEGDVKRHFLAGRTGLASSVDLSGRRWSTVGWGPTRHPGSRVPRRGRRECGSRGSVVPSCSSFRCESEVRASAFSAVEREPSFHRGLRGPSHRSVLGRGMAYPWGLHVRTVGPGRTWMLTSDLSCANEQAEESQNNNFRESRGKERRKT